MDQTFLNLLYAAAMAITGWLGRVMWESVKELQADLSKLREELPKTYVTKDDIKERFDHIDRTLDRIWAELKSKQDKP